MASQIEFKGKGGRDIRINRDDEPKYKQLKDTLKLPSDKSLFLFAMKVGFFYDISHKIVSKPKHKGQVSELDDESRKEMMIIGYATHGDIAKIFDIETIKICEEYAAGGIHKLYQLFVVDGANKDNIRIIEDVLKELDSKI